MSPDSQPKITLPPWTSGEDSLRPGSGWRHSTLLPCLLRRERHRLVRLQADGEQPAVANRRATDAFSDPIFRFHSTWPLSGAERVERPVLVHEVDPVLDHDRLELEQLARLEAPLRGAEGRVQVLAGR